MQNIFNPGHGTCLKRHKSEVGLASAKAEELYHSFRCLWFRKLLYQANLHGICTRATTAMDRMLVSNSFEAIGNVFNGSLYL